MGDLELPTKVSVLTGNKYEDKPEGVQQGDPRYPIMSNIVITDFDRELERHALL